MEAIAELFRRSGPCAEIIAGVEQAAGCSQPPGSAGKNLRVRLDPESGKLVCYAPKRVALEVLDPDSDIHLEKAPAGASPGDVVEVPAPFGTAVRSAAWAAREVLETRLRAARLLTRAERYRDRIGRLETGIVARREGHDLIVNLGPVEGRLPASEQSSHEVFNPEDTIRAAVQSVEPVDPPVILSRIAPEVLAGVIERETPEVRQGVVSVRGGGAPSGPQGQGSRCGAIPPRVDAVGRLPRSGRRPDPRGEPRASRRARGCGAVARVGGGVRPERAQAGGSAFRCRAHRRIRRDRRTGDAADIETADEGTAANAGRMASWLRCRKRNCRGRSASAARMCASRRSCSGFRSRVVAEGQTPRRRRGTSPERTVFARGPERAEAGPDFRSSRRTPRPFPGAAARAAARSGIPHARPAPPPGDRSRAPSRQTPGGRTLALHARYQTRQRPRQRGRNGTRGASRGPPVRLRTPGANGVLVHPGRRGPQGSQSAPAPEAAGVPPRPPPPGGREHSPRRRAAPPPGGPRSPGPRRGRKQGEGGSRAEGQGRSRAEGEGRGRPAGPGGRGGGAARGGGGCRRAQEGRTGRGGPRPHAAPRKRKSGFAPPPSRSPGPPARGLLRRALPPRLPPAPPRRRNGRRRRRARPRPGLRPPRGRETAASPAGDPQHRLSAHRHGFPAGSHRPQDRSDRSAAGSPGDPPRGSGQRRPPLRRAPPVSPRNCGARPREAVESPETAWPCRGRPRPPRGFDSPLPPALRQAVTREFHTSAEVELGEAITVKGLAEAMRIPTVEVIKALLLQHGVAASINQPLDTETATKMVVRFGRLRHHRGRLARPSGSLRGGGKRGGGRYGRAGRARAGGHGDGPCGPRQDEPPRRDPAVARGGERGRRHHPAHERLHGGGEQPPDRVPRYPGTRGVHQDARPRGRGHRCGGPRGGRR